MIKVGSIATLFTAATLLMMSFVNPFIKEIDASAVIFSCLVGGTAFLILIIYSYRQGIRPGIPSILFFLYICFSGLIALLRGIPANDVVRSVIPFIFFPFGVLAGYFATDLRQARMLSFVILTSALIFLVDSVLHLYQVSSLQQILFGSYRLTFADPFSALPYGMVGIFISLAFVNSKLSKCLLVVLFIFYVLATKSKGLVLSSILAGAVYLYIVFRAHLVSKLSRYGIIVLIMLMLGVISVTAGKLALFDRFDYVGSEMDVTTYGRLKEVKTALNVFIENPILGAGSGYTFHYEYIPATGSEADRRYTHESITYFLATTGLLGFGLYFLAILLPLYHGWKFVFRGLASHTAKLNVAGLIAALISIHLYNLVSANYKLIHVNLLIGVISGLVYAYIYFYYRSPLKNGV